jgi:hypothetical protein
MGLVFFREERSRNAVLEKGESSRQGDRSIAGLDRAKSRRSRSIKAERPPTTATHPRTARGSGKRGRGSWSLVGSWFNRIECGQTRQLEEQPANFDLSGSSMLTRRRLRLMLFDKSLKVGLSEKSSYVTGQT